MKVSLERMNARSKSQISFDTLYALGLIESRCILAALSWLPVVASKSLALYKTFVNDCVTAYLGNRFSGTKAFLLAHFKYLFSQKPSCIDFTRVAIKILNGVCADEIKIFKEYFPCTETSRLEYLMIFHFFKQ